MLSLESSLSLFKFSVCVVGGERFRNDSCVNLVDRWMLENIIVNGCIELLQRVQHIFAFQFHEYGFPLFIFICSIVLLGKYEEITFIPFLNYIAINLICN